MYTPQYPLTTRYIHVYRTLRHRHDSLTILYTLPTCFFSFSTNHFFANLSPLLTPFHPNISPHVVNVAHHIPFPPLRSPHVCTSGSISGSVPADLTELDRVAFT